MKLESKLQASIVNRLRSEGWLVNKIITCSQPGTPDLIIHRDKVTAYIEVKRFNQKPTPLQVHRMKELIYQGIPCITVSSTIECLTKLESII